MMLSLSQNGSPDRNSIWSSVKYLTTLIHITHWTNNRPATVATRRGSPWFDALLISCRLPSVCAAFPPVELRAVLPPGPQPRSRPLPPRKPLLSRTMICTAKLWMDGCR